MAAVRLQAVTVDGVTVPPSRAEIRAYTTAHVAALVAAGQQGENPHHLMLDHSDQVERFIALLPIDQRDDFVQVYSEEMRAAMATAEAQAQRAEGEAMRGSYARLTVVRVGGFLVVVVLLVVIFRQLS